MVCRIEPHDLSPIFSRRISPLEIYDDPCRRKHFEGRLPERVDTNIDSVGTNRYEKENDQLAYGSHTKDARANFAWGIFDGSRNRNVGDRSRNRVWAESSEKRYMRADLFVLFASLVSPFGPSIKRSRNQIHTKGSCKVAFSRKKYQIAKIEPDENESVYLKMVFVKTGVAL